MKNIFEMNQAIIKRFFFGETGDADFDARYLEKNNLIDYERFLSGNEKDVYEDRVAETAKAVDTLNRVQEKTGIPYFAMKSFLNYPYIDDDIDFIILGDGYDTYVKELKSIGFFHRFNCADIREPLKRRFRHNDYFVMPHLHRQVSWNGIVCCDKNDVFKHTVEHDISGVKFRIPSDTDELLIAIGHFLFENYYFKLGELLYIKHLLESDIDYERIERISAEYGYRKGVNLFFAYLYSISNVFDLKLKVPVKFAREVEIDKNKLFPYYIPYSKLIPTYWETLGNGLKKLQVCNLFRKLFTYIPVGYLWKYRLSIWRQNRWF